MKSVEVNIQPEIIKWALAQTPTAKLDEKFMNNITNWLDGTKTPTFKQIETLSKKTNIPLGYFFLQKPPVEQIKLLEYRTVDSIQLGNNPSRNLIDTIYSMENVQEWFRDYRQEMGYDNLDFVGCMMGVKETSKIVERIRSDLGLSTNWYEYCNNIDRAFKFIRERLEICGVVVMMNGVVGNNTHRPLDVNEFRAFAMVDDFAPLIFINAADSKGAKLFSLLHETVHIWLGENSLFNNKYFQIDEVNLSCVEIICNAVAGELLVPKDIFLNKWAACFDDVFFVIKKLARYFCCGQVVVARKALDCNLISRNIYNKVVYKAIEDFKQMKVKQKGRGGNYPNTLDSRLDTCFVKALCESINMGRTSYTEAYRLTNTNRKTFSEMEQRIGGVN